LETGSRQFTLLRGAITAMRRAYPQFLAAGGETLPKELLKVIFPIGYWDLIRKHAAQQNLDPYVVAALVAQESTFVPDIRSSANAVGLMQLLPSTARQYARALNMKYSPKLLTNPEANIRIGTAYLADKLRQFGELHLVLASYNAGERAVRRWIAERPTVALDEFIDDIPFPETQNYVKKILGTADDYRRLYGSDEERGVAAPPPVTRVVARAAPSVGPKVSSISVKKKPVTVPRKKIRAAAHRAA
jgi:soluble lytic murein transglycosylase